MSRLVFVTVYLMAAPCMGFSGLNGWAWPDTTEKIHRSQYAPAEIVKEPQPTFTRYSAAGGLFRVPVR